MIAEIIIGGILAISLAYILITFIMSIKRKRLIKKYNIENDISNKKNHRTGAGDSKEAELIAPRPSELEGRKLLQTTTSSDIRKTSNSSGKTIRNVDKLFNKFRK